MKTNTLVLVGFLGASLAGCEVRCLSPKDKPVPRTQATTTGSKLNVNLVEYEGDAGTGQPDTFPAPSDAEASQAMRVRQR